MLKINEIETGKSYGCKFSVETMLDIEGNPLPNLDNKPIAGPQQYSSFGIILMRDLNNQLVRVLDESSKKQFIVPFSDISEVDIIEWVDPLEQ